MAMVPASEQFTKARDGFRRVASGFTPGQKAVTAIALVAVVAGGLAVMSFTGKPTYQTLFTNLQPQDAATITQKLTSDKVPYQLAANGTAILVPANDVNQERLSLASAGLPASSTVGLSLLDKEGITASNMTQQADYLQAIQGELEQTIDSIAGVQSSQVNVAMPTNQDFALSSNQPTGASVMVSMQPGRQLSDSEVQAIVHLVGSSVPGLQSGTVTVADSNGNLLAGPGVAEGVGGSNSQTDSYDQAIQQKVQNYLTSVLGQNNADVQVNATLDYSQTQTTTNSILPNANGQLPSFCTQTSQSSTNYTNGAVPAGAAGSITPSGGSSSGNYTQTQTNQTCETSEQTQTVQQAPGTLKSQSVSVLVNQTALPAGTSMAALQQGVAAAAGINTARGDQLAFAAMPFNTKASQQQAAAAKAAAAATQKAAMGNLIRTAVVLVAIGFVCFILWRSARKARSQGQMSVLSQAELALLQGARSIEPPTSQIPAVGGPAMVTSGEAADVNHFIDSQPDDVARMLRTWLNDKRGVPAP